MPQISQGKTMIIILICLIQALLMGPAAAEVVDRIVAQVNDEIITMSELEGMAKAMQAQAGPGSKGKLGKDLQRQMLDALIDRKLAISEAKKRGIAVSDKELNQALDDIRKRNNITDDAALDKALSQEGLTLKDLKQQITEQLLQERLLSLATAGKGTVSDAEVRRFYDEHAKEGANQVHLRLMNLPFPGEATAAQKDEVQKKAEEIIRELRQGRPFPEVAKKHGAQEMDLGFMAAGDVAPQLAEHINRMKPGEIAPVVTPKSLQLVQLVARRAGKTMSFEEAAPEIRKMLMRRDMDKRAGEWLKGAREKAAIKIML